MYWHRSFNNKMTLLSHCADDSPHSILMRNLRLLRGFYEVKPIHVSSSTETIPSFYPLSYFSSSFTLRHINGIWIPLILLFWAGIKHACAPLSVLLHVPFYNSHFLFQGKFLLNINFCVYRHLKVCHSCHRLQMEQRHYSLWCECIGDGDLYWSKCCQLIFYE